eukprot:scaffold20889_cov139-Isochrysis_galbana.AAC.5
MLGSRIAHSHCREGGPRVHNVGVEPDGAAASEEEPHHREALAGEDPELPAGLERDEQRAGRLAVLVLVRLPLLLHEVRVQVLVLCAGLGPEQLGHQLGQAGRPGHARLELLRGQLDHLGFQVLLQALLCPAVVDLCSMRS